jgi:hypothetical protein
MSAIGAFSTAAPTVIALSDPRDDDAPSLRRAARWGLLQTAATYSRYRDQIDEGGLQAWPKDVESRFRAAHTEPLERLEKDWWAAAQDALLHDGTTCGSFTSTKTIPTIRASCRASLTNQKSLF